MSSDAPVILVHTEEVWSTQTCHSLHFKMRIVESRVVLVFDKEVLLMGK